MISNVTEMSIGLGCAACTYKVFLLITHLRLLCIALIFVLRHRGLYQNVL